MGCGAGAHKKYSNPQVHVIGAKTATAAPCSDPPRPDTARALPPSVIHVGVNGAPPGSPATPSGSPPLRCEFSSRPKSPRPDKGRDAPRVQTVPPPPPLESHRAKTPTGSAPQMSQSGRNFGQTQEILLKLGGDRPGDVHKSAVLEDLDRHVIAHTPDYLIKRMPSAVSPSETPAVAVGIDLGSKYSCVAAFNDLSDQLEIVTNNHGNRQTPSYVAFNGDERLVGDEAYDQVTRNPKNTIFDAQHLTKRSFADQSVQAHIETLPYEVTDSGDEPLISVTYKGVQKMFYPTQISEMVLTKLKFTTESYLRRPVQGVVITVPISFTDRQRQAVKDTAFVAGFREVTLLNQTTAAAIAYVYGKRHQISEQHKDQILLVLRVGRSSCDAALVKVTDRSCHVIAACSHAPLGGLDLNRRLVEYCKDMFKSQNNGRDISESLRALERLRKQVEHAKRILSSSTHADVEVDSLFNGVDFSLSISRHLFEDLNKDLLQEVTVPIGKVLQEASMHRRNIDDVLLVGGSVRIPKVQALVREFLDGKELCMTVDPSEAVAFGAGVYASCLACQKGFGLSEGFDAAFPLRNFSLKDVMPVSLGVETSGGEMTTLVPRNTRLPHTCEKIFTAEHDKQESVVIRAFEGEALKTKDNYCLGILRLELKQAQLSRSGMPRIKVQFSVDADGILTVNAQDLQGGAVRVAKLRRGVYSASDVKQMMQDAELFAREDVENRERIKARNALEHSCYSVRAALANHRGSCDLRRYPARASNNVSQPSECAGSDAGMQAEVHDMEELENRVQDILDWLDFGDPLLHVAAQLKERFPEYSFGYDGQTLAKDAPLRELETPLKESRKGYREALESISERDTLQVLSEMDCERSYRGKLLKDASVLKLKQQADDNAQAGSDETSPNTKLQHIFEPDPLWQEQHIVADLMRIAAVAQEVLRHKLAPAERWSAVPGKTNMFECTESIYADLVRDPGIKSEARVRQKANAKYRHLQDLRFARVRDIARFALTYDTLEGLLDGLQRIRHDFKVVELENRFAKPTALGWRDVTLLIQMQVAQFSTSHIAEIQMSHKSLVRARQDLHKHWKLVRELLPGTCKVAAEHMDEVQDTILCELQSSAAAAYKFTTSQFKGKLSELHHLVVSCGSPELCRALESEKPTTH